MKEKAKETVKEVAYIIALIISMLAIGQSIIEAYDYHIVGKRVPIFTLSTFVFLAAITLVVSVELVLNFQRIKKVMNAKIYYFRKFRRNQKNNYYGKSGQKNKNNSSIKKEGECRLNNGL
jgi:hypothetical protein